MRRWVCICLSSWSKGARLKVEVVHEGPHILDCTRASSGVWVSLHLPGGCTGAPGFGLSHTPILQVSSPSAWWCCPPPRCSNLPSQALGSSSPFITLLHSVLPELPPLARVFLQQFHKVEQCLSWSPPRVLGLNAQGTPSRSTSSPPYSFWDEVFVVGPFPSWGVH